MILQYLSKLTVYQTIPVYNLNWLKNPSFYAELLEDRRVNIIDVGARNSSLEELQPLNSLINYLGFDADKEEVDRLNSKESSFNSSKFIAAFVAGHSGNVDFMLHKDAGNSSIYQFNKSYSDWYHEQNSNPVERIINLPCDTLDNLIDSEFDVDVIKLDTQGNEYEILSGASKVLEKALMVELEVEFLSMYEGQKLAYSLMEKMNGLGFDLLYLNRVFGSSRRFKGISRGQLIFGDALFGLSRESVKKLSVDKKIKYCSLLINYGHCDFAYDLYLDNSDIQDKTPKLKVFFEKLNRKPSKLSKFFKFLVDKVIFVLLYLRRTNGLSSDSDRSWPVR